MFDLQENLKKLPDSPGVYMHKDKMGQVIYVGKALSLRSRVRQYFQSSKNMDLKVRMMVGQIAEFEYITTDTEMEALILENNLIKKYMPKYNVLLRDDKTYPYIKVTMGEAFPRVLKTRKIEKDSSKYFGPYSDAGAVNLTVELLGSIYRLKGCSARHFPTDYKPCLNYHIQKCRGICMGNISKEEYGKGITQVLEFLGGRNKSVLDYLKEKMLAASNEMNFEEAAKYRDYIEAVYAVSEKQHVVILGAKDLDIVLTVRGERLQHAVLFYVREGKLSGRETFPLQAEKEDESGELAAAFIKQYYSEAVLIPKEILVAEKLPDCELIQTFLSKLAGSAIKISIPQRGDKKALLDLAIKDVIEMTKTIDERTQAHKERKLALGKALYEFLNPDRSDYTGKEYRIEAYDISNTNGVDTVGAMVVFEGTTPRKKDYRRFKVRTVEGPNDYGSLQEVVFRRFNRMLEGDSGFASMPDLLLIDGGKNQVSVVEKVLCAMKIDIPVLGMAKDDHHRTKSLIYGEREILLKEHPLLFKYIGTIQEEAHRFAIEYHRGLRDKKTLTSALDEIEGVGPSRRNALLAHFGGIEAIKKADMKDLCQVKGITEKVARNIKEYFN